MSEHEAGNAAKPGGTGREPVEATRPAGAATDEHEFYAEPATLTGRDAAGVVVALLALLLIGVGGYLWLTPGMSLAKMVGRPTGGAGALARAEQSGVRSPESGDKSEEQSGVRRPESGDKSEGQSGVRSPKSDSTLAGSLPGSGGSSNSDIGLQTSDKSHSSTSDSGHRTSDHPLASTPDSGLRTPDSAAKQDAPLKSRAPAAGGAADGASPVPTEDSLLAAANGDRNASCAQCGMFAGKSYSEIVAQPSTGGAEHFDSWGCAFGWAKAQRMQLKQVLVLAHGSTPAAPQWLSAASAWFVYDTKSIKGSMPPFVAAFATKEAAQAAQATDGGQLMDWEGLQSKFK